MANGDLTQFNATPVFTATADVDTNAEVFLIPTDSKLITATSNAAGQAPVNPSIKRLKALIDGLRGATIGDFAGAVPRSFKSLQVDLTGGVISVAADGTVLIEGTPGTPTIIAYYGDIVASNGDIEVTSGHMKVIAGNALIPIGVCRVGASEHTDQTHAGLKWIGTQTTSADSNPAQGVSTKNQLRAKNTCKYWGRFKIVSGVIGSVKGFGNFSATIVDRGMAAKPRYVARVTMADAMDDADYHVSPLYYSGTFDDQVQAGVLSATTTTTFDLFVMIGTGTYPDISSTWDADLGFEVMGQQTT